MSAIPLHKPLLGVTVATAVLLLVPALAMQFSLEVSWGPGDFLVAAVLLFGAGSLAVVGCRRVAGTGGRIALIGAVGLALLLVWADLAVGLFH